MNKATGSKINNFNLTPRVTFDENVFRLQITVNQIQIMNKVKSIENLLGDFLKPRNIEVVFLLDLSVVFRILIEIVSKEFSDNDQMLFVVELVDYPEKILHVQIVAI